MSYNFEINGGKKLLGEVTLNTAKNSATALIAASLLNSGTTTLKRMPQIEEVSRLVEVMRSIGVKVRRRGADMSISVPKKLNLNKIDQDAARKTRSVLMFAGPLAHIFDKFKIPSAGGCKLGSRVITPHQFALEKLGINMLYRADGNEGYYTVKKSRLKPAEIILYESSDTATINAILAAAKIQGKTTIKYASANYQVQDICAFLQSLGVSVKGVGTTTLEIDGVKNINARAAGYPSEDPIEAMFFIAVAATTGSELKLSRAPIDFIELELLKLKKMGLKFKLGGRYKADNQMTDLVDMSIKPSSLKALDEKIYGRPYPGLNIDNLPFFAVIATQAKGTTLIHDWVYEGRAIYFTELKKLGAKVLLADPHRVFITGPTILKPAEIECPPALRPATILLIAMLGAKGRSVLRNIYSINRGYENLPERLRALGADIRAV